MSDLLRSSSIPSPSTRSAFSRRRFVTLQLTDLPLSGSSSIPPLSTGASTATSLSVGPLSVGSLPVEFLLPSIELQSVEIPSVEIQSIELPSIEPSPVEPTSKISSSGRFPFAKSSLATSSSPGPRLLEPRLFGTRWSGLQVPNGSNPEVYHIDVKTFTTNSPCTVFNLPALGYDTSDILAVIGKVQGVGDFDSNACHHCTKTWEMCTTPSTLKIFSEGTEGVLGTHGT
ncbi:hypothetical protein BCON_0081g00370 [Botryotinia convoluta]|uniref:Uncharacterized protein n=1 Tax=Botryotinia convoluta TaxID=54673 RepID=A0A4Z1I659_9HELO|nr:hypothetical protein BCON_0081g00370 [Botryotinia convoluta]